MGVTKTRNGKRKICNAIFVICAIHIYTSLYESAVFPTDNVDVLYNSYHCKDKGTMKQILSVCLITKMLSFLKMMGDFIEPGTHRSTNIKVKIETL